MGIVPREQWWMSIVEWAQDATVSGRTTGRVDVLRRNSRTRGRRYGRARRAVNLLEQGRN